MCKQTFYPDTLFSFTSYAKEGNFEVEMVSLKTSSLWTKINKDNLFKKGNLSGITSSLHVSLSALFLPFHLLQFQNRGGSQLSNLGLRDRKACKQVLFNIVHD